VSPLTTSESMFGTVVNPARSNLSDGSSHRRRGSPLLELREESSVGGELICDYDDNVTPLYEMLESSQWDKARLRCRTHPEEVQTWIVRRDASSKIRWKLLPLHAAVIFQAPSPVLECLIKEYPIAAGQRDDQGMLPLHLAFRHKQDEEMLLMLLDQYPQGLSVKDRRERLPIDHGKETDFSSHLLQRYAEVFAKCVQAKDPLLEDTTTAFEMKMNDVKTVYEERINALAQEHEQALRDMKLKVEQDQHVMRSQHDQEMDELRDLLSREVASGQKASKLERDVHDLRNSLIEAKQETEALRTVLHDQKSYQEELKDQVRKVLADQKTLTTFCTQQQEQLEEAQQFREQLLRSLLQKEDGKAVQACREICQLSEAVQLRAEQLLNQNSETVETVDQADAGMAGLNELDTRHDVHEQEGPGWGAHAADHEDDISAITENSNF